MPLDTLKLARRLAAAGMPPEQADGVAAAIADGMAEQVASKADLAELRSELKTEMAELRAEMKTEFAALRTEMAAIRTELANFRTATIQWIVGAILLNWVAMAGLIIALSHR